MALEKKKFLALFALFIICSGYAAADYVGTAPGNKDLGVIERGESVNTRFYVLTDVSSPFSVSPKVKRPATSMLREDDLDGFRPDEMSQEDITPWVDFTQENYVVDPSDKKVIPLDDGGVARVSGEVEFNINVPRDAEPGYHAGVVRLNPDFESSSTQGAQLQTLGLTRFRFFFRVPGKAVRDINVMEVNSVRQGEQDVRLDYLIQNNGTVTVLVNRFQANIFDKFGNQTHSLANGGAYIKPGNTKVIQNYWRTENIESGEYRVQGDLNYVTGNSFMDSSINVSDYIQIRDSDEQPAGGSIPWWIIAMALVLLGVLMYYFEIDPVIIFSLMGIAGISAAVLMLNLPTLIIPVIIIMTLGILVYGR